MAIFFGEVAQRGQRTNVAVHGKYAVRDQQLLAGCVLYARQLLFRVSHVFVPKDESLALDKRAPSMMEAWFSWSEMMKSSLPRIAETVPAFAANPDWNTTQASTFLKRAIFSSSSM